MPVIALTQEMGSLAKDVAVRLAGKAGLTVLRHEMLNRVADRMDVAPSLVRRLREGQAGLLERLSTDKDRMALFTAQEVYARAAAGNIVLRGWGATCLLQPVRHVVRVRVTRPFEQRVAWLMDNIGTDDREVAEDEVRRSDKAHAARMNELFGVTWGDPLLYDLVLNTDRVSVDSCVDQILRLAAQPEFQETAQSRAKLQNLALESAVRAALKENAATRSTDIAVEADAEQRGLVLRGLVLTEQERAEVERVAAGVPGAGRVDNQLRLMTVSRRFAASKT